MSAVNPKYFEQDKSASLESKEFVIIKDRVKISEPQFMPCVESSNDAQILTPNEL